LLAAGQPQPVAPGAIRQAVAKGGATQSYSLRLPANRYIQIEVLQEAIDVMLRLVDPAGKTLVEVDSPNGSYGPEPLMWIAEVGGTYRLEVFVPDKDARAGRYRLSYQADRTPTERDKESVAGQRAYLEAQKLGLEPDFGLAKERYTMAIEHLGQAGQRRLQAQAMRVYGSVLFDHDDYEGAVGQHRAALRIFESMGDYQEEEIVLDALGQDHSRLGQYSEAAKAVPVRSRVRAARRSDMGEDVWGIGTRACEL